MNEHVANSFLAGFHAQFGVSPNVVMGLAERATGDTVVQARRIVDGYDNEVYRVILASGRAVYPRIRRGGEGGVGGEVWAMDQARRAGVPVPEVVTAGTVATEEGDLDAMVVAEAPGRPLANLLPSPSPPLRRAAMENLGRVLGVLHSIRTPGAWRPSDGGRWPDPAQVHQWFVAGRVRDRDDLVAAGLEVEEVEEVEELLHQSWDPAEHATPVLCHRDVSPDHVFVDADLRVTGLIDWGMWQGGPPTHDLANVALRNASADFAAVVDGHGGGPWPSPPSDVRSPSRLPAN